MGAGVRTQVEARNMNTRWKQGTTVGVSAISLVLIVAVIPITIVIILIIVVAIMVVVVVIILIIAVVAIAVTVLILAIFGLSVAQVQRLGGGPCSCWPLVHPGLVDMSVEDEGVLLCLMLEDRELLHNAPPVIAGPHIAHACWLEVDEAICSGGEVTEHLQLE
jgi:hypothetical protein